MAATKKKVVIRLLESKSDVLFECKFIDKHTFEFTKHNFT